MTIRQDAWSVDDDLLLAEVVLRHIREGSTQLAAFEEVGEKLSRTSAACGFRWNSTIRKKYESAITLAKKQRGNSKVRNITTIEKDKQQSAEKESKQIQGHSFTVETALELLSDFVRKGKNKEESEQIDLLKKEKSDLELELKLLKEKYTLIENDYRTLMTIMERARTFSQVEHE